MPETNVEFCRDLDALAERAADQFIAFANEAIAQRGRFTLALSGGSTPEKLHRVLAKPDRSAKIDWARVFIFIGDERYVPTDDPASNYGMARRTLLDKVPVPPGNVFPMPTSEPSPAAGASAYIRILAQFFAIEPDSFPRPRLDLILLGLGDDGHTASLFPGKPALHVNDKCVTWSPPGTLPPPVDRITLTFPVLNAARHVLFLVAGEKKAPVLREILEESPPIDKRPAAGIRPVEGTLTWLIDEAAASQLTRR